MRKAICVEKYDVIVAGGGLAALRSAVSAAQAGARVCLLVKTRLCSGSSFYPGMEMVACQSSANIPAADEQWLDEIMRTSCGVADRRMNEIYIRNIRSAVKKMPEIGIFHARETEPKLACFAEQIRPAFVWGNWAEIRAEAEKIIRNLHIEVRENTRLLSILRDGKQVCGVTGVCKGEISAYAAPSVILATGGMGGLYRHSLNTPETTGDGQTIALLAGAPLINAEFLQFIPGFIKPAYKTVFREMSMPYIRAYTRADGRDLFEGYPLSADERAACLKLRSTHGPFSAETISNHFDIAMMRAIVDQNAEGVWVRYDSGILKDEFTFIRPYVTWLRENRGIEIDREPIMIAPFCHAANGGVRINARCETDIRGLFACGEVSGGIHGANRQGGMSTGSCLVFGDIAGRCAAEYAQTHSCAAMHPSDVQNELETIYGSGAGTGDPDAVIAAVQDLMWKNASIIRSGDDLVNAMRRIERLGDGYSAGSRIADCAMGDRAITAQHMLVLSRALLAAMLNRRESRGAHYRIDYPNHDDANYLRRFEVHYNAGEYTVRPERNTAI